MRLIKSVFYFIVFVAVAVGFFALIRFEISYGVAGGSLGGAQVSDSPGSFWFFIEIQALMGLNSLVSAIKEIWNFTQRKIQESDQKPPANIIAIYWLLATFLLIVLCLLSVWSMFDMLYNAYNLLDEFEMPEKAILAGLFLICLGVLCNIIYMFLIRNLIDTFFPKARISIQILRKAKKD